MASPSSSSASPTTATEQPPTCASPSPGNGGNLADPGSVAYNFTRKGVVEVAKTDGVDEDSILMAVLDAGAEEVEDMGGVLSRSTPSPVTSSPCAPL